jgi:hypothetical protein
VIATAIAPEVIRDQHAGRVGASLGVHGGAEDAVRNARTE